MTISVRIAAASHLSDAQEIIGIMAQCITVKQRAELYKDINNHINFSKRLMHLYPDTRTEVEESRLDEIWSDVVNNRKTKTN